MTPVVLAMFVTFGSLGACGPAPRPGGVDDGSRDGGSDGDLNRDADITEDGGTDGNVITDGSVVTDGSVITPDTPPIDPPAPYELVAGGGHTCALDDTNLRCWGLNDMGQLGVASTATCSGQPCTLTPTQVLANVTKVSLGQRATCAIRADKTLWCFGDSRQRQLGLTPLDICPTNAACVKSPTQVPDLANVIDVAVGTTHTCVVLDGGTVQCTGSNSVGEMGNGTTTPANVFAAVPGITTATAIRVGANFACALLADHTLTCWGHNLIGQLGRGTLSCTTCTSPMPVVNLTGVRQFALGSQFGCAVRDDLGVSCWGSNQIGQSGAGGAEICTGVSCNTTPRPIPNHTAFEVETGAQHACSRHLDGTTSCWGSDFAGQLGIQPFPTDCGGIHPCAGSPRLVTGTVDGRRLALGDAYSCVLVADGTGQCWGNNAMAQYGDGSTLEALTPLAITNW